MVSLPPADRSGPEEATPLRALLEGEDSTVDVSDYETLPSLAQSYFQSQRTDHPLQPSAFLHEAYLNRVGTSDPHWKSPPHLRAVEPHAMRRIPLSLAEAKDAANRGGGAKRVPLDAATMLAADRPLGIVAQDQALTQPSNTHARQGRVVEPGLFRDLKRPELAVLDVSQRTVGQDRRAVRAWLNTKLAGDAT